jgi:hypothetical protein
MKFTSAIAALLISTGSAANLKQNNLAQVETDSAAAFTYDANNNLVSEDISSDLMSIY